MENNNVHVHTFTQTVIPPTCKEKGYTLHRCECGYEHKDSFKPLASHDFDVIEETKPTCTEGGARKAICKVCGTAVDEQLAPLGHSWGQWNINEFATCTEEGKQTRFCGRCGESETQAIKPTGHKFAKGESRKVDGYVEHFCENCGETVKVPTRSTKIKNYVKNHKATTIFIPCGLISVTLVALLAFFVLIPAYHYNKAHKLIDQGEYTEAFTHMTKALGYKDASKLIDNFVFEEYKYVILDKDGNTQYLFEDTYDKNGNIIFNGNNTYEYEYDESGKILRMSYFSSNGELCSTDEYEYNKDGNIAQIIDYDSEGKLSGKSVYEYDANGRLLRRINYSADNQITGKSEYDKNGNLTERAHYHSDGEVSYVDKYEYDKENRLIKNTYYNYDSDSDMTYVYEYSWRDIQKKFTSYDKNGKIETESKITYEFEDNKMIITYKAYDKDGEYIGEAVATYSNVINYIAK